MTEGAILQNTSEPSHSQSPNTSNNELVQELAPSIGSEPQGNGKDEVDDCSHDEEKPTASPAQTAPSVGTDLSADSPIQSGSFRHRLSAHHGNEVLTHENEDPTHGNEDPMKSKKPSRHKLNSVLYKIAHKIARYGILLLGLVVMGIVVMGLILPSEGQREEISELKPIENQKEETTLTRFIEMMEGLKNKFPDQDRRLWKTFNATAKRIIIDEHPIQPAVFLIASTKSTYEEADCLALQFSRVITKAFQSYDPVYVNVSAEYRSITSADAKIVLERSLKNGFDGGSKSAVITNLEDLQGDTAMLLHAFCDNENAPYTKVVILFTIHIDENAITEGGVEEYLTKIWRKQLNIDDIGALLSRVANNIVIVRKESELQQACHI